MNPIVQTFVRGPVGSTGDGNPNPIALDQKRLAKYVGLVAFALPIVLYAGSFIPAFCRQSSISHYYFLPFLGSWFVGCLGFIGVFMFCYRGHTVMDRVMAKIGAVAAILVAIFPTQGDGCAEAVYTGRYFVNFRPDGTADVFDKYLLHDGFKFFGHDFTSQVIHLSAAALLFSILGWFALWSFRRNNGEGVKGTGDGWTVPRDTSTQKSRRNGIYLVCGLTIFACIGLLALTDDTSDGVTDILPRVFTLEAIALFAFGLSWVVKGRFFPGIRELG